MLEEADALDAFVAECKAAGLTDAVLLGMGGSSLAPEVFRLSYGDAGRPAPARARLDRAAADRGRHGRDRPRDDAVHRLDEVGRDDRDAVAVQALPRAPGRRRPLHRRHRPRLVAGRPGRGARLPPHVHQRPRHRRALLGALLLRARPGRAGRRRRAADPRGRAGRRGRRARTSRRPRTTRACGSGSRSGSSRAPAATSSPSSSTTRSAPSASGPSSSSRRARASRAAASSRSPTSPLLAPDAYGSDRVFLHLRNTEAPDADHDASIAALAEAGHPTITVHAAGPDDLGRVFFLSEFATAVVGWVLEINPFDQPNVQQAKDATQKVLDEGSPDLEDGDLGALLGGLEPPAYLAIMGYLPYSDEIEAAAGRLREAVDRAPPRRHHLRLRPALPALDRAVPQGRPDGRALPPARSATPTPTRTSRAPSSTSAR